MYVHTPAFDTSVLRVGAEGGGTQPPALDEVPFASSAL